MTQANVIAQKVDDQYKYQRQYPVSKAQQQVLTALGITIKINGASHAEQIFEALGITVASKRQGRASVPVVTTKTYGGGFNAYGEGEETFTPSDSVDLSAIRHWMA